MVDQELELFVEYPMEFDGQVLFLSYSGEHSLVSFLRDDPQQLHLFDKARGSRAANPRYWSPGQSVRRRAELLRASTR